jgi:hypothetical protein
VYVDPRSPFAWAVCVDTNANYATFIDSDSLEAFAYSHGISRQLAEATPGDQREAALAKVMQHLFRGQRLRRVS